MSSPDHDRMTQLAEQLTAIGIAISAERDVQKILDMIVDEAMTFTNADAATLYLVTPDEASLHFAIVRNRTLGTTLGGQKGSLNWSDVPLEKDGQPNMTNVSAYAAILKEPISIADVYKVENFDFSGTREYDAENNYRCKSMLVVPMRDHESCVTGVLQLINAIPEGGGDPISFTEQQQDIVRSLASQAAVALNNARLIDTLKTLFDSFVATVAAAIDAKSPYTGGHVRRVTGLTLDIARAITEAQEGRFKEVSFVENQLKEIRTAAWLHDFGKVATPETLLDKHTKLEKFTDRVETVGLRYDLAMARHQLADALKALADDRPAEAEAIVQGQGESYKELVEEKAFVLRWNDSPRGPSDEEKERLARIAQTRGLLTEDELTNLCIPRGTLTATERKVIEEHAAVTRATLQELHFPHTLSGVPSVAGGHHEMLDGSGYPDGLKGDEIPLPTRILTVADIFEALTAERPYKKSMPAERALSILNEMADAGKLDRDVIQIAVDAQVFSNYSSQELEHVQEAG